MQSLVSRIGGYLWRWLTEEESENQDQSHQEILRNIELARQEWLAAQAYFANATDSDLIDHAIYSIGAAERKYMFLLKEAKRRGILSEDQVLSHNWIS